MGELERDVHFRRTEAHALCRFRRYPVTKEVQLTCVAGHVKPKESKFPPDIARGVFNR
jgi:hypothetical protein